MLKLCTQNNIEGIASILISLGTPKYFESFRMSDTESGILMEKLGYTIPELWESESLMFFPIQNASHIAT